MKLLLVILSVVASALAEAPLEADMPTSYKYHERFGVAAAARIKAAEDATDFDGSRIVGGSHSRLGQFPHMAGLDILLHSGRASVCGASLLNNRKLVTAAHCWHDGWNAARQFTVVLGSIRLYSGGTRIPTTRVQQHIDFMPQIALNDIAIVTISSVPYSNNIRYIQFAAGSLTFAGSTAVAVGFGRTADNAPVGQNQVLSHVNMPVITNAACAPFFPNIIFPSTLCASGAGGRSTCSGDSGGPLQVGNLLVGITSFVSTRGCSAGQPAGFARVTHFAAWIRARL